MAFPDLPDSPITVALVISCAGLTEISERWAYTDMRLSLWSTHITFPYPSITPANRTRPSRIGRTGVPTGTEMSTPRWRLATNAPPRTPKGLLIGPSTGHWGVWHPKVAATHRIGASALIVCPAGE